MLGFFIATLVFFTLSALIEKLVPSLESTLTFISKIFVRVLLVALTIYLVNYFA